MSRTVTLWMLTGFVVAGLWVVVGLLFDPHLHSLGHSTLVAFTAPASVLGRRMPLGMGQFVLLNGGIYACVGLLIGTVRFLSTRHHV